MLYERKGLFLVVEGVSGSGKSSIANELSSICSHLGLPNIVTKEPSSNFNSNYEQSSRGCDLFELILKDRSHHVQNTIQPNLKAGVVVICDRYVPSSLVYQQIDGLERDFIWQKNQHFPTPDLTILLNVSTVTIEERMKQRKTLSRFENVQFRKLERELYIQEIKQLENIGWNCLNIDNENNNLDQSCQILVDDIKSIIRQY